MAASSRKQAAGFRYKREGVAIWQKPLQGWLTCNVDAAVKLHESNSSFGCVLRNDDGIFVAAYGGKLEGIVDPKIAEAMTFREALSWLKNRNSSQVYIELDCLGLSTRFIALQLIPLTWGQSWRIVILLLRT